MNLSRKSGVVSKLRILSEASCFRGKRSPEGSCRLCGLGRKGYTGRPTEVGVISMVEGLDVSSAIKAVWTLWIGHSIRSLDLHWLREGC